MSNIRHTWGQIKNRVGLALGMCGDHPNLLPLVNEATELLWAEGDWIHKMARYKFRVGCNCHGARIITWPTEVETIEALRICNSPISVKNLYYEFINNGLGDISRQPLSYGYNNGGGTAAYFGMLGDREEVCTFEDIIPGAKKLKVYNSLPADDGVEVLLLGYDDNNQWIRTIQDGVYSDGEILVLNAGAPPITQNFFSNITGVQFSVTPRNGVIYLVEFNTVDSVERTISAYQYSEDIPIYRRSVLTGVNFTGRCEAVTGLVRLRFVPIIYDTDYLQIGNLRALRAMLLSLQKQDNGDPAGEETYKNRAVKILDNELKQYQGVAPKKNVNFQNRRLWGTGINLR